MKRIGGLVLVTACMGVLSSCASLQGLSVRSHGDSNGGSHDFSDVRGGGGSVDSGVADATATGEGDVGTPDSSLDERGDVLPPLGSFDRSSASFELFDPCSNIDRGNLEKIGLTVRLDSSVRESGLSHCGFEYPLENGGVSYIGLGVTDLTLEEIEKQQASWRIYEAQRIPAVAFHDRVFGELFCTLYIETVGGTITLNSTGNNQGQVEHERCGIAEKVLTQLMELKA